MTHLGSRGHIGALWQAARVWRMLVLSLVLVGARSIAFGQECGESLRPPEAFREAALVFRGTVQRIEDPAAVEPVNPETGKLNIQPASGFKIVTFQVAQTWKGSKAATVQVFVFERPPTGGGFVFQQHMEYVVYAVDVVNQHAPMVERFAKQSKVYGIGLGCVMRVRHDVENEAKILDGIIAKESRQR